MGLDLLVGDGDVARDLFVDLLLDEPVADLLARILLGEPELLELGGELLVVPLEALLLDLIEPLRDLFLGDLEAERLGFGTVLVPGDEELHGSVLQVVVLRRPDRRELALLRLVALLGAGHEGRELLLRNLLLADEGDRVRRHVLGVSGVAVASAASDRPERESADREQCDGRTNRGDHGSSRRPRRPAGVPR